MFVRSAYPSPSPRRAWLPSGVLATWGQGDPSTAVPLPSSHAPSMDEQCRGRAGPRGPDEPSEKPPWAWGSRSGPSRFGEVQTSQLAVSGREDAVGGSPVGRGTLGFPQHLPPLWGGSPPPTSLTSLCGHRGALGLVQRQEKERGQKVVRGTPCSQAGAGTAGVCEQCAFRV